MLRITSEFILAKNKKQKKKERKKEKKKIGGVGCTLNWEYFIVI